jgi:hypothetical protein
MWHQLLQTAEKEVSTSYPFHTHGTSFYSLQWKKFKFPLPLLYNTIT